jgi:hypothetical protein
VHSEHSRSVLGIHDHLLNQYIDSDSPLNFWQVSCPTKSSTGLLRLAALRVLSGKPTSLGVERLWSGARLVLTDNRRSMGSARLMQLLNAKLNMHLLEDSMILEQLGVKDFFANEVMFEDVFEEVQALCEEEEAEISAKGDEVVDLEELGDDISAVAIDEPVDLFSD